MTDGQVPSADNPIVASPEFALVFAGDEGVAMPLSVAIYSALTNLSGATAPEIFVLDGGLSGLSRARLQSVADKARAGAEIRWIRPPDRLSHVAGGDSATASQLSRLLIPELLPRQVRRAVYLDADILVRRDLSSLFSFELGDAPIAAVRDFMLDTTAHEWSGIQYRGNPKPYFNSGVLVMDLRRWRSLDLSGRLIEYATARGKAAQFGDQEGLNAVAESWRQLGFEWNVQVGLLFLFEFPKPATALIRHLHHERWRLYRAAAILHFAGARKPWAYWYTPGTLAWIRTLIRTGWYTRTETLVWLVRWLERSARYLLGTARTRLWMRLMGNAG